ncbi:hypothetical protein [Ectobacillus funiculus]|uniref:Uncharacterized protein n=1 Tax=Ectobacillus funiculus TaxID=137993 RepID=A0ABV5WES0_9BACI
MKLLVRIALCIGVIVSALPIALVSYLRNNFKIELGFWAVASGFSCSIFVILLAATLKPQKTGGSPSNSEKTP